MTTDSPRKFKMNKKNCGAEKITFPSGLSSLIELEAHRHLALGYLKKKNIFFSSNCFVSVDWVL